MTNPYRPDDGREDLEADRTRVLRGGAWGYNQRLARCADRIGDAPDGRDDYAGFRVSASPGSP